MLTNLNEYVVIYLFGCVVAFVLLMFNTSLIWFLRWLTKANVVYKNLAKIEPPDETTFKQRTVGYILTILFEIVFSWIGVLLQIWLTITTLLTTLREVLTETPEAIKELRFPLKTSPNMSREAIWAHVMAVQIKTEGIKFLPSELVDSLDAVRGNYSSFDQEYAMKQLAELDVVSADTINATLNNLIAVDVDAY